MRSVNARARVIWREFKWEGLLSVRAGPSLLEKQNLFLDFHHLKFNWYFNKIVLIMYYISDGLWMLFTNYVLIFVHGMPMPMAIQLISSLRCFHMIGSGNIFLSFCFQVLVFDYSDFSGFGSWQILAPTSFLVFYIYIAFFFSFFLPGGKKRDGILPLNSLHNPYLYWHPFHSQALNSSTPAHYLLCDEQNLLVRIPSKIGEAVKRWRIRMHKFWAQNSRTGSYSTKGVLMLDRQTRFMIYMLPWYENK